ncbi:MAG: hypothetical protein H0T73_19300 [Ardenticatenales bacterium]|nr:hypothetical protein [Ardenticatenales bacterium]
MSDGSALRLISASSILPTEENTLHYLPFGTTTLKLRFDPPADCPEGVLFAAPKQRHLETERVIVGHEDEGQELWITWGGGKVEGIHFTPSQGQRYLYFNISHRGDVIAEDFPVTIQVKDAEGFLVEERCFTFYSPHARQPVRLGWQTDWPFGSTLRWQGKQVPRYQSRWWPQQRIEFDTREAPPLSLRYDRITTSDRWGRVILSLGDTTLAKVEGRLESALHDGHLFDADLFHFHENIWAVRLWFVWLHNTFTQDDIYPDLRGRAVPLVRDSREEIPDAERFDILVDVKEKLVTHIGTDNHYKELWGQWWEARPVLARIGQNVSPRTLLFILAARATDTLVSLSESRADSYDPAAIIREEFISGSRALTFEEVRDSISWEAHAPIVDNFRIQGEYISGDVRVLTDEQ